LSINGNGAIDGAGFSISGEAKLFVFGWKKLRARLHRYARSSVL